MLINRASASCLGLELRAWSRRRRGGRCALNAQIPLAHSVALAALFERELLVWLACACGHVDDRSIPDLQALALCGSTSKTKQIELCETPLGTDSKHWRRGAYIHDAGDRAIGIGVPRPIAVAGAFAGRG